MAYATDHFAGKERNPEEPPWGVELNKGGLLTTNQRMFQGLKGTPAHLIRRHTTNHFDPQSWRDRSSYMETFFTPQMYSRHSLEKTSPFRNHRPHPRDLIWPMEPYKGYMIWNPKIQTGDLKRYSAPSLLRHYNENHWRTTTGTTYQDYFTRQHENYDKMRRRLSKRESLLSEQSVKNGQRPGTEVPLHLRTAYQNTFNGEPGRPSTDARPIDYSWRNIRY